MATPKCQCPLRGLRLINIPGESEKESISSNTTNQYIILKKNIKNKIEKT